MAIQSQSLAELPQLQQHLVAQDATVEQLAENAQLFELQATIALVSLKLVYTQAVMTCCTTVQGCRQDPVISCLACIACLVASVQSHQPRSELRDSQGFVRSAEIRHVAAASSASLSLISRHGLTDWRPALQHQCSVLPLGPAPVLGDAPFQETSIPVVSTFVQTLTWPLGSTASTATQAECFGIRVGCGKQHSVAPASAST